MFRLIKFRVGIAAAIAVLIAGCSQPVPPHLMPLPAEAQALLAAKGMAQNQPIHLRVFKEESELELWKVKEDGLYHHYKTYPICNWSGKIGPKLKMGDLQAPEGFYKISTAQMNPSSQFHLAFNIGFPNSFDKSHGRTGQHLMIHGDCVSTGCYAMTDALIEEIYILAREAFKGGQESFELHAFPFRMTKQNMRRHRRNKNYAFWGVLKKNYDYFEAIQQLPPVEVCEKRYLINVAFLNGETDVDPVGACPAYRDLPREAIPPDSNITQAKSLIRSEAPISMNRLQKVIRVTRENQGETANKNKRADATGDQFSTFHFAPDKPTASGHAFGLNSKLGY